MTDKPRKSGLVTVVFENIFAGIPGWLGKKAFEIIQKIRKKHEKIIASILISGFSLIVFFTLFLLSELFELFTHMRIPVRIGIFYMLYLTGTFPFFLLFAYTSKEMERKLFGEENHLKLHKISDSQIKKARSEATGTKAYLGSNLQTKEPLYLTDAMRQMHTHCVGSTGVGKTESVMLPLLRHDIENGKGAIVIDAKGDLELLAKIRHYVKKAERKDFYYFSLTYPEISCTYNPLLRGSASELKDKLVSATEWREEFYKKKAEEALLTLLRPMVELGRKVKFRDLYYLMTDSGNLRTFKDTVGEGPMYHDLQVMENHFGDNHKFLSGIIADLGLITKSEFGPLVDVDESQIDLRRAYINNEIVYFSLSTQAYEETAKRFGRLVLQDIKTVSNEIQTKMSGDKRHFFSVFIDEFASFTYESFLELLNKGRGAGLAITLLHQSLGDLATKRTTYQQQILENTNIKIIMRQDDPYSIEKFAKIGGAKRTMVSTYQTEERVLGTGLTGVGSLREGQTFRIDPDLVRKLGRGEAIVVSKAPAFHIDYVKLDYENENVKETMKEIEAEKEQAQKKIQEEKERKAKEKEEKAKQGKAKGEKAQVGSETDTTKPGNPIRDEITKMHNENQQAA